MSISRHPRIAWIAALLLLAASSAPAQDLESIDAFWAEASRTVAEGDFDAYAALYHADAVLVNGINGTSTPIADALARWKSGFEATAAGRMDARVDFRFTRRIHGDSTAHETGIFRYVEDPADADASTTYVRFEALLVRTAGGWRWLMEYQTALATKDDWVDAAPE